MTATVTPTTALTYLSLLWGATVTPTHDLPRVDTACTWCSEFDRVVQVRIIQVRIIHDPRPDATAFAVRECCLRCAETCVTDAHTDHDPRSRRPIRVEVGHP